MHTGATVSGGFDTRSYKVSEMGFRVKWISILFAES